MPHGLATRSVDTTWPAFYYGWTIQPPVLTRHATAWTGHDHADAVPFFTQRHLPTCGISPISPTRAVTRDAALCDAVPAVVVCPNTPADVPWRRRRDPYRMPFVDARALAA